MAKSSLTSTTRCLHPHVFGCLFPFRKELAGLRQRSFALEAVGMPAQVSKFGENKPFTNRNGCFGSRNKLLAAHETCVSCFKTNLFRGQMAIQCLHEMSSSFCTKHSAGKLNFGHRKACFRLRNLCFPQKTQSKLY